MNTPEQLATLISDVLHDRLENSTREQLAIEAASLRAFVFSTLNSLDHITRHIGNGDVDTMADVSQLLAYLTNKIETSMANLEDVRLELQQRAKDARMRNEDERNGM